MSDEQIIFLIDDDNVNQVKPSSSKSKITIKKINSSSPLRMDVSSPVKSQTVLSDVTISIGGYTIIIKKNFSEDTVTANNISTVAKPLINPYLKPVINLGERVKQSLKYVEPSSSSSSSESESEESVAEYQPKRSSFGKITKTSPKKKSRIIESSSSSSSSDDDLPELSDGDGDDDSDDDDDIELDVNKSKSIQVATPSKLPVRLTRSTSPKKVANTKNDRRAKISYHESDVQSDSEADDVQIIDKEKEPETLKQSRSRGISGRNSMCTPSPSKSPSKTTNKSAVLRSSPVSASPKAGPGRDSRSKRSSTVAELSRTSSKKEDSDDEEAASSDDARVSPRTRTSGKRKASSERRAKRAATRNINYKDFFINK
jgi:hypothetical protein